MLSQCTCACAWPVPVSVPVSVPVPVLVPVPAGSLCGIPRFVPWWWPLPVHMGCSEKVKNSFFLSILRVRTINRNACMYSSHGHACILSHGHACRGMWWCGSTQGNGHSCPLMHDSVNHWQSSVVELVLQHNQPSNALSQALFGAGGGLPLGTNSLLPLPASQLPSIYTCVT